MKKIYLAHAYSDEKLIRLWQINTQKKIDEQNINIFLHNPFYTELPYHQMLKNGEIEQIELPYNIIVNRDLMDIKTSDILVALIFTPEKTLGTYMEIALAKKQNPDIIVCVVSPHKYIRDHLWIREFADRIFPRLVDFENDFLFKLNQPQDLYI